MSDFYDDVRRERDKEAVSSAEAGRESRNARVDDLVKRISGGK